MLKWDIYELLSYIIYGIKIFMTIISKMFGKFTFKILPRWGFWGCGPVVGIHWYGP